VFWTAIVSHYQQIPPILSLLSMRWHLNIKLSIFSVNYSEHTEEARLNEGPTSTSLQSLQAATATQMVCAHCVHNKLPVASLREIRAEGAAAPGCSRLGAQFGLVWVEFNAPPDTEQNYPGSVASYNTRPGNEVGLFYTAPEPTREARGTKQPHRNMF